VEREGQQRHDHTTAGEEWRHLNIAAAGIVTVLFDDMNGVALETAADALQRGMR